VRKYRLRHGISQAQLARQLGVSRAMINRYEAGARSSGAEPSDDTLAALAQALGVTVNDLLTVR